MQEAAKYGTLPYMNRPTLSAAEEQSRRALKTLLNTLDVSTAELATQLGRSRQWVEQRRDGWTRIRSGDELAIANALDVERKVFFMTPDEVMLWLATNRRDMVLARSRCTEVYAGQCA